MKWLISVTGVAAGAALMLIVAGLAGTATVSADNGPHVQGAGVVADSCAGCHRAHTGQADSLLTEAQTGLCLTCHDGTSADTNVVDGVEVSSDGALRAGGFTNARLETFDTTANTIAASTPQAVSSEHDVDVAGVLWGNGVNDNVDPGDVGGTTTLRCGSCHDPHGNDSYRILRPKPNGSGAAGDADVADEVTIDYTTTNYFDVSGVSQTEISAWCGQCHTRYLASTSAANADFIFTYRHESDGSGSDGSEAYDPGKAPSCIRCHVSHGTNAVTYSTDPTPTPGGDPTPTPDPGYSGRVPWPGATPAAGDTSSNSRLLRMDNRGICQKCHNK